MTLPWGAFPGEHIPQDRGRKAPQRRDQRACEKGSLRVLRAASSTDRFREGGATLGVKSPLPEVGSSQQPGHRTSLENPLLRGADHRVTGKSRPRSPPISTCQVDMNPVFPWEPGSRPPSAGSKAHTWRGVRGQGQWLELWSGPLS